MYNFQVKRRAVTFSLATFFVPLLSALFLSSLLLSGVAQAKTTITLEGNRGASFSSGQLDPNGYKGEIFGVEILEGGRVIATADRLLMDSEGEHGSADFIVTQFEIDNLVIEHSEFSMEVGALRVSNVSLASFMGGTYQITPAQMEQWKSVEWLEEHSLSFRVEDIKMAIAEAGIAMSIAKISNPAPRFAALADGTAYVVEAKSELSSMRIMPFGENEAATSFRAFLEKTGLEYLEFSMSIKSGLRPVNDDIVFSLSFDNHMTNLFDILVDSELYISQDNYKAINETFAKLLKENPNTDYSDGEQSLALMTKYFGPMIKDIRLGKLQLAITDKGLLNITDQFKELPPRAVLAPTAEAAILSFLPQNGSNLAPSVRNLLMKGGTLQITAEPRKPLPLMDFVGAGLTPDQIASQLRLSATHKP